MGLLLLGTLSACGVQEFVSEAFRGETPRERYGEALERAGLNESLMVQAWHRAGERAIHGAVIVTPPIVEEIWMAPDDPGALGYRVDLRRGQRIEVAVEAEHTDQQFFVELFRERGEDGEARPLLVKWAEESERGITYDARTTATYLLRVQTELLGGGPVAVSIRVDPSLAFPVQERSTRNILSYFGDVRDGGARDHHGVDIFAPRGTPVLAATDGTVYRVQVTARGGNVVWLRDPSGDIRSYYAHLDTQLVQEGQEVREGDVLGLVGNTGNAITTAPHLHFGIYMRPGGPVDPWYFLHDPERVAPALAVSRESFRETLQVRDGGAALLAGPDAAAASILRLPERSFVRVLGGTGRWFRVRMPMGQEGYVPAAALELAEGPLDSETRLTFAFQ